MRVLLRLAYDGTSFRGWQIQPGQPTVQGAVEDALGFLCGRRCPVTAAGRTDSGVHALSMPAHADVAESELDRIRGGLNGRLPRSIRLLSVSPVRDDFHARFDAVSRSYRYSIGKFPDPFSRFFSYQPGKIALSTERMREAAAHSLGSCSWRGFAKEGSGNATWDMRVMEAGVEEHPEGWNIYISADRFLRGVVRIWSGTIYRAGTGSIPPETVREILLTGNRELAGPSLPACGLTLTNVEYPNE